jgi:paraquat-inducible protein B
MSVQAASVSSLGAELPTSGLRPDACKSGKKSRRRGLIWLLAAVLALTTGLLAAAAYKHAANTKNLVTVHFQDAQGLKAGADLRYRGVTVGRVIEVHVRPDLVGVDVRIALTEEGRGVARRGSRFWIVHPTVSMAQGISGLETAIGDKYVVVQPAAAGESADEFEGVEEPPQPAPERGSRTFVLRAKAAQASAVRPGAPVTCCGIRIGQVRKMELAADGQSVRAVAWVGPRYARLVGRNSSFAPMRVFQGGGMIPSRIDLQAVGGGVELKPTKNPGRAPKKGQEFPLSN